ncbi:MAG: HmuY family protein [Bacteroidota bacterium]
MKQIYLLLAVGLLPYFVTAQQIEQVSVGAGYADETFYSLSDSVTAQFPHTDWDLAFGVTPQAASIFINEAVALSMGPPLPEFEVYVTTHTDFTSADSNGMTRIYNGELDWSTGALNDVAAGGSFVDLGWGTYNTTSKNVDGSRVFVVKLRSGTYKKLWIESLASGVYTLKHADLDGMNETTLTVDKANFAGKSLAYLSLETGMAMDLEPSEWDMKFTRYYTPLPDGTGGVLNYMVTGVLTNAGVSVAQADGIDPLTVDYNNYAGDYTDSTLTEIGHDWKDFDLNSFQWTLPTDRVYFVRTATDSLWKLSFVDFEGSSTGITTIEKEYLTVLTSVDNSQFVNSYKVYPNPASNQINVAFETERGGQQAQLRIINQMGQIVSQTSMNIKTGLNVKQLPINLPTGMYHVAIQMEDEVITQSIFVK